MGPDDSLNNIVRVGTVHAVDFSKTKARVWYDDLRIMSGWLGVLQLNGAAVKVAGDGGHTHDHTVSNEDGHKHDVADGWMENHWHDGTKLADWMPSVNSRVLVLYLPVPNGDGFILGGIS